VVIDGLARPPCAQQPERLLEHSAAVSAGKPQRIALARLLVVLDEVRPDELEKVREDCWVLSQTAGKSGVVCMVLSAMWRWKYCRPIIVPALIELHRSPDHQSSLLEAIRRINGADAVPN